MWSPALSKFLATNKRLVANSIFFASLDKKAKISLIAK
jgi:hypothetical protein